MTKQLFNYLKSVKLSSDLKGEMKYYCRRYQELRNRRSDLLNNQHAIQYSQAYSSTHSIADTTADAVIKLDRISNEIRILDYCFSEVTSYYGEQDGLSKAVFGGQSVQYAPFLCGKNQASSLINVFYAYVAYKRYKLDISDMLSIEQLENEEKRKAVLKV